MYIFTPYALLSSSLPLHFHTLPPSDDFSCALSSSKILIHASYRPIIISLNLSPRNSLLPTFMQILLDAAVKPYLPCQICFCISPLLIYASPSDHRFPELLLMQLSFTGQSYKPCATRRETDPPYQPPLPFFSASHPCFPVRLPFPCIDSHETFFSGNHTNLARCCHEIVPAISILFYSSPHLIRAFPSDYRFPELLLMKLSFPSVHGPIPDSTAKPNLLYQIPFRLLADVSHSK